MSRRSPASSPTDDTPSVLPVPEPAVAHHERTLGGPMKEWLSRRKLPPVLLLTGLPGVGKRPMAYHLAQWILCERVGINAAPEQEALGGLLGSSAPLLRPCGECSSCRKAIHGSWVDFKEIAPEDGDGEDSASGNIKIEQFRKLKSSLGFAGYEGQYRVVLVPDADRMTIQAANSLLKLLEEPPPGWIFFLTAGDATLLLPTIVSRCQVARLKPFPTAVLEQLLELAGVAPDRRALCSRLAEGSWGKAMAWADDSMWELRKQVLEFFKDPAAQLNALVDKSSQQPGNLERILDQLESLTADLIRWSLGSPAPATEPYPWLNLDAREVLTTRARASTSRLNQSRAYWITRAEQLAEARQKLSIPLNRKLLAQDLLIPWLEETP